MKAQEDLKSVTPHHPSESTEEEDLQMSSAKRVTPLTFHTALKSRRRRGSALVMATVFTAIVGSTVSYIMLSSNNQTRQTHRTRLMDTSLSASAAVVRNMAEQAYFMATTRPAQLQGDWRNLNALIKNIQPKQMPGYLPAKQGNKNLAFMTDAVGNGTYSVITDPNDDWSGFNIQRWTFDAVAFMNAADPANANAVDNTAKRLGFEGAGFSSRVQVNYIPLYQYAIFYNNDLEFHPGPTMNVLGPVHTNKTLWLGAGNTLNLESRVSAAGNVRNYTDLKGVDGSTNKPENHRKSNNSIWIPETGNHYGEVNIKKGGETLSFTKKVNDKVPGDTNKNNFLESTDSNWLENALSRFKGQVADKAMGEKVVQPPLPFTGTGNDRKQVDASELIQRVSSFTNPTEMDKARMEIMADIRITGNPSDLDKDGYPKDLKIEVTKKRGDQVIGFESTPLDNREKGSDGKPKGNPIVSVGEFTDNREKRPVKTLDVDMGELAKRNDVAKYIQNGNGVLYVSTNNNNDPKYDPSNSWARESIKLNAVRITNAKALPAKTGDNILTIATDRPMYLQGDVNTGGSGTPKRTLLLASDSLTVTSQKLTPALTSGGRSFQTPGAVGSVETNAIFMIGEVSSKYQKADANGKLIGNADTDTLGHHEPGYKRKQWSGGVHNVIRYLEGWGGKKHTFNGSLICLFESRVATARHQTDQDGDRSYYGAPDRNYKWDSSLQNVAPPKGMPVLVQVKIAPLQRISKAEAVAMLPN